MTNNEQTQILEQAIFLLLRLRNEQSIENWEANREKEFTKLINSNGKIGQNIISKSPVDEVKEMMIKLNIKGSVRQRKNGLLEARTQLFGSTYGRTADELNEKLSKKILESVKPSGKSESTKKRYPLLSEFYFNSYVPYKKRKKRKDSTLQAYGYHIAFIISENFDKALNSYTAQSIENFLYSIEQTRKRQIIQGFLNNVFMRAVAEGVIKNNPCAPLEKMEHDGLDGSALSFEEQKQFFTALLLSDTLTYTQKCYYIFVYLTGTRRSEALAAVSSDLNLTEKILQINGTKTAGSLRYIPLTPLVERLLTSLNCEKNGKLFPISSRWVDEVFKKFMTSLNFKHKLHDLRHTFGTIHICVENVGVKTVSLWMGHSTIDTTLRIYTHPEQLDKATFLRGDLSEREKNAKMKAKYSNILKLISDFLK